MNNQLNNDFLIKRGGGIWPFEASATDCKVLC